MQLHAPGPLYVNKLHAKWRGETIVKWANIQTVSELQIQAVSHFEFHSQLQHAFQHQGRGNLARHFDFGGSGSHFWWDVYPCLQEPRPPQQLTDTALLLDSWLQSCTRWRRNIPPILQSYAWPQVHCETPECTLLHWEYWLCREVY